MKGKAVPVSEEFYKAYWNITEHEKYLQRKDWKHNVISFSALDHDGHFVDSIIDEKIDLEKEFKFSHIIFDHGIGEMADFITIEENGDFIYVEMYHCKAKKGRVYNSSVGDVNEVTQQEIKSTIWVSSKAMLLKKINDRVSRASSEKFIRGEFKTLKKILQRPKYCK